MGFGGGLEGGRKVGWWINEGGCLERVEGGKEREGGREERKERGR